MIKINQVYRWLKIIIYPFMCMRCCAKCGLLVDSEIFCSGLCLDTYIKKNVSQVFGNNFVSSVWFICSISTRLSRYSNDSIHILNQQDICGLADLIAKIWIRLRWSKPRNIKLYPFSSNSQHIELFIDILKDKLKEISLDESSSDLLITYSMKDLLNDTLEAPTICLIC